MAALSRRGALRGSLAASLGLVAGVAPVLAGSDRQFGELNPDADLIAFAGRVERLVQRERHVRNLMVDAQGHLDRWDFANKPREPAMPKVPSRMVSTDLSTATHRVIQWSEPLEPEPAQVAIAAALDDYRSACEAHRHAVEAREARSRAPYLEQLADRLANRLARAIDSLVEMQPTTPAGLAAKAAAVVLIGERVDGELDGDESRLALSLCEDAVRLHAAGAVHV